MKVIDKLPETLVIDRSKWYRGRGHIHSALLVTSDKDCTGHMCCLGFLALACGLSEDDIRGVQAPSTLTCDQVARIEPLMDRRYRAIEADDIGELMEVNDNDQVDDEKREAKVVAILGARGCKVTFIN